MIEFRKIIVSTCTLLVRHFPIGSFPPLFPAFDFILPLNENNYNATELKCLKNIQVLLLQMIPEFIWVIFATDFEFGFG